jgi:hypothetical protein
MVSDTTFYRYASKVEAVIDSGINKFDTQALLEKLCRKYKYVPKVKPVRKPKRIPTKKKQQYGEEEQLEVRKDETTKALFYWFQKVKKNGRPDSRTREALNYVITALMTAHPNVSALGRELGVATDGAAAKRWQEAKSRVILNLKEEDLSKWVYTSVKRVRSDMNVKRGSKVNSSSSSSSSSGSSGSSSSSNNLKKVHVTNTTSMKTSTLL